MYGLVSLLVTRNFETTNPLKLYVILYIHVRFYGKRLWSDSQKDSLIYGRFQLTFKGLPCGRESIFRRLTVVIRRFLCKRSLTLTLALCKGQLYMYAVSHLVAVVVIKLTVRVSHSTCVQVTLILVNNGPKTWKWQCWQFGYAKEEPWSVPFKWKVMYFTKT